MQFAGKQILILGGGVTGSATGKFLEELGAQIKIADERPISDFANHPIDDLKNLNYDLAVVSPGWRPDHPLISALQNTKVPFISEIDLAWELRNLHNPNQKWLAITGTNGKTTTTELCASMLNSAGIKAKACGNVGTTVIESVLDQENYQVLVIEISSFQIHWMNQANFVSVAILIIADDHIDWHGSFSAYTAAKVKLLDFAKVAIINGQDAHLVEQTNKYKGRRILFTLDTPKPGELGLVEELLVDRAFTNDVSQAGAFCEISDVQPTVPHAVANTLAAAGLARSIGAGYEEIQSAIKVFTPGRHRLELVLEKDGIRWVNDSKATNPHAAKAALFANPDSIWIAGGLAKGANFAELVESCKSKIKYALLIGSDREEIAKELEKQKIEFFRVDGEPIMEKVIQRAKDLAKPGDTVLLAPAAASMDQFKNYSDRGDQFTDAVKRFA
ncbi:MAG: UDP-N-acetylmuramoyl-L-alanine--D-glutamate ligase [Candidatus Nanopelagicaceae bacterium]